MAPSRSHNAAHGLFLTPVCCVVPVPGILERLDLRVAVVAFGRFEQDVVVGVRIERRVEVDQVHAFGAHVIAQDVEIVAVIERVGRASP